MKTLHASEAYWMTRLAPYLLAGALAALGLSLIKAIPPMWCMLLGSVCGGLVFLFKALKWRTGREGFEIAAIGSWLFPCFMVIELSRGSGGQPRFQYFAIFAAAYFLGVAIFRRQIRAWIQT
jgi:hypothetical protein